MSEEPICFEAEELARIRHDVNTPLTIITGFAGILASDREISDEQRRDYATRVLNAGNEVRELLKALKR